MSIAERLASYRSLVAAFGTLVIAANGAFHFMDNATLTAFVATVLGLIGADTLRPVGTGKTGQGIV